MVATRDMLRKLYFEYDLLVEQMEKKEKKDDPPEPGHLCMAYGGCMKVGYVRYFATVAVEDEYNDYRYHYGGEVKARYVKSVNPEFYLTLLKKRLEKDKVVNLFGDLYELPLPRAVKYLKEITGEHNAYTWGFTEDELKATEKLPPRQTDLLYNYRDREVHVNVNVNLNRH